MSPPRGFSLLEVLIGLAVVAVALGAATRLAGQSLDSAQGLRAVTLAQWCADNHLTGLHLRRQAPDLGTHRFECRQMGWTMAGQVTVAPTPNPLFRRVEVRISEGDRPILSTVAILGGRP